VSALATNVGPFALPTQLMVLLICAAVAAAIGHFVGRPQKASIGGTLTDMALAAGLAARLAFVALWFEHYRDAPWSIFDIRDGGFTPWAGVLAAILVAIWQGWRHATLRGPLLMGLLAGTLTWIASLAVLRLGEGPTLSDLEEISFTTLQDKAETLAGLAHGRPLVVNLWATWCPPCRREMPVLAAAQLQVPGVNFVFANQGEYAVTVQKYLAASQLSLANVLLDPGKKLGQQLGSMALPTTLFYDASGRLVDTHLGALSSASLASKLDKLQAPSSSGTGVIAQ
jgi:thiol-disulfide isomerase/thioredoxin